MLCPSSSPSWGTGTGGTINDGVGTGLCSDAAEATMLVVLVLVTVWVTWRYRRLSLAAAATLASVSAYHLVYGENVIYYAGTSAHSRQIGTPLVTALLSLVLWCSTPPRCAKLVASVASSGYVSWSVAAAIRHPLDRASDEYTAFDGLGIVVAGLWWYAGTPTPDDDGESTESLIV